MQSSVRRLRKLICVRCAAPGTREREGPTCGCRKMARRRAPCFRPVLYRELCNCSAWCGYGNRNPACALMLRDAAQRGRAGARLRELACCATPQHEGKRGRRVWPSEGLTRGCRKRARRSAPCFRPVLYRELYNCSAWRVWHVTRGSIILRKIFFRSGWIAGSSPAMTAEGRLWTRVTPLNALLRSTRARIGFADLQEFTGEPCPEDGSGAVDAPFAPRLIYPSMRTGRALIARAGSPACTAARARAGS